ncbi:hypothetical protein WL74_29425 [Burkholderia cepacia]|nr:hypothetical protein WL74_29425 [Burkholderia cepacia]
MGANGSVKRQQSATKLALMALEVTQKNCDAIPKLRRERGPLIDSIVLLINVSNCEGRTKKQTRTTLGCGNKDFPVRH